MAWPDYPPPGQILSYEEGLSGTRYWVPARDGGDEVRVPMEWAVNTGSDWVIIDGYYYEDEWADWLAGSGGDDGPSVPAGIPGQVVELLGQAGDPIIDGLAEAAVPVITMLAKAYTRDQGFEGDDTPNEEIEAVIVTASARLVANPEQLPYDSGATSMRGGFNGWTLAERAVLNRYRRRAA